MKALTRAEKERAQMLSEDLYSVGEPGGATTRTEMNTEVHRQLNEAIEARRSQDWDRAIALLRTLSGSISPALLSHMRGSIWQMAGFTEVASVFFAHAAESEPMNPSSRATDPVVGIG